MFQLAPINGGQLPLWRLRWRCKLMVCSSSGKCARSFARPTNPIRYRCRAWWRAHLAGWRRSCRLFETESSFTFQTLGAPQSGQQPRLPPVAALTGALLFGRRLGPDRCPIAPFVLHRAGLLPFPDPTVAAKADLVAGGWSLVFPHIPDVLGHVPFLRAATLAPAHLLARGRRLIHPNVPDMGGHLRFLGAAPLAAPARSRLPAGIGCRVLPIAPHVLGLIPRRLAALAYPRLHAGIRRAVLPRTPRVNADLTFQTIKHGILRM